MSNSHQRRGELTDKKHLKPLTPDEASELDRLNEKLDAENEPYYKARREDIKQIMNHLIYEKIIYRYISAFEQGDFEALIAILQQAEQDPELETMLWEVSEQYGNEHKQIMSKATAANADTYMDKLTGEIEAQIPDCVAINIYYRVGQWSCSIVINSHQRTAHDLHRFHHTGNTMSDAINSAWHKAMGSDPPPF
ncbi:MAG: hypothetical protein GY938_16745 [Ketobacter sp.]|nr:hypothetical protein [Ketobacter sp.]